MEKRIIFLQNIIAPYRISLFNNLENIVRELSLSEKFCFTVYIMRITEAGRNWTVNEKDFHFNYYIDNGFYVYKWGYHLHFNIDIIKKILKQKNQEVILGGSWNNLNVLFIILLKRLRILKNKLHIWSEANYLSLGSQKGGYIKTKLRSFVFNTIDGSFLLPGRMSLLTFERWGIVPSNVIYFPNLIDQSSFIIGEDEILRRDKNHYPVLLFVARLEEKYKGILNFFNAVGIERLMRIELRIAGEGSDKGKIIDFIRSNKLGNNIKLLGNLTTKEVIEEYKRANIFLLPSFSDQSPLTIIEAITMQLPLLISECCGNHYEALMDGENGYIFNPYDKESIIRAFDNIMHRRTDWYNMGGKSKQLAMKNFSNQSVLENFIKQICC